MKDKMLQCMGLECVIRCSVLRAVGHATENGCTTRNRSPVFLWHGSNFFMPVLMFLTRDEYKADKLYKYKHFGARPIPADDPRLAKLVRVFRIHKQAYDIEWRVWEYTEKVLDYPHIDPVLEVIGRVHLPDCYAYFQLYKRGTSSKKKREKKPRLPPPMVVGGGGT